MPATFEEENITSCDKHTLGSTPAYFCHVAGLREQGSTDNLFSSPRPAKLSWGAWSAQMCAAKTDLEPASFTMDH